ncbi:collagen-like protein [Sugiyamaella lignohabitans]|uniref:Collagen-like protein n=1 Tax=Sugiyamaella lignohabitans TaxID=796027 RepID=A0A161HNV8_9ASCO|nr:collagen-like protein [Sugiyamaella lignohabitans]ANB15897.1 collagen-like protein [Sugiyamaella lignohabitans]
MTKKTNMLEDLDSDEPLEVFSSGASAGEDPPAAELGLDPATGAGDPGFDSGEEAGWEPDSGLSGDPGEEAEPGVEGEVEPEDDPDSGAAGDSGDEAAPGAAGDLGAEPDSGEEAGDSGEVPDPGEEGALGELGDSGLEGLFGEEGEPAPPSGDPGDEVDLAGEPGAGSVSVEGQGTVIVTLSVVVVYNTVPADVEQGTVKVVRLVIVV